METNEHLQVLVGTSINHQQGVIVEYPHPRRDLEVLSKNLLPSKQEEGLFHRKVRKLTTRLTLT